MTRVRHSIFTTYLFVMLLMTSLPMLVVGYFWVSDVQNNYQAFSEEWQQNHRQKYQAILQHRVDDVLQYISFRHSQINELLRQQLRRRVDNAMMIADALVQPQSQPGQSQAQQLNRFLFALGNLPLQNQQGAYWVFSRDGTLLMGQGKVQLAAEDLSARSLTPQQRVIKSALDKAVADGEAYATFYTLAEDDQRGDARLAYARYHPQFDVVVISHNSLSGVSQAVKAEVLERFGEKNQTGDSSIFIAQELGGLLVPPGAMRQFDGLRLAGQRQAAEVDTLWRSANDGLLNTDMRFLEFEWLNSDSGTARPSLSYAQPYADWRWMVGAELSLVDYYKELDSHQADYQQSIKECVVFIVLLSIGCLALISFAAYRLYRINAKAFKRFIRFFNRASVKGDVIDIKELPCREFQHMAEHANRMLLERCSYEQALKTSRQRFRMALQASKSYMWDLDYSHRQLNFSNHFFQMLAYQDVADGTGYSLSDFFELCHPEDRPLVEKAMLHEVDQLAETGLEFRIRNAAGEYRWFYSRGGVVDEGGVGRANRLAGILNDIHEHKKLESDLQRAHVEVQKADVAREQFLSSMSHELHTPLNNILGHLQLLQRGPGMGEEQKQQLTSAENAGYYLLRLINDILELSKIESGNTPVQVAEYSVVELSKAVCDKMIRKAAAKNLSLMVELDPQTPASIVLDGYKLKQVLVALISNAIKYTESGRVVLQVSPEQASGPEARIQFKVCDTGVGIAEDSQSSIFQPFSQLGGINTYGTGLGLSIASRLAKSMGAELQLDSELGEGSEFSLSLPLAGASSELLGGHSHIVIEDDKLKEQQSIQVVGLAQEQHKNLYEAAKMGDIETLQDIFKHLESAGFAEHDWLKHCKQLLSHFDLDSLMRFLDNSQDNNGALV